MSEQCGIFPGSSAFFLRHHSFCLSIELCRLCRWLESLASRLRYQV